MEMNGGGSLKVKEDNAIFIDLGSGLGGASEAFMNDPKWEVFRFDNSPHVQDVPNTVMMDLTDPKAPQMIYDYVFQNCVMSNPFGRIIIWASPPCEQWSQGYASQLNKAKRKGEVFIPDLRVLNGIMKTIHLFDPEYWYVENVVGGQPFIDPLLGPARLKHRPWIIWGDFPLFDIRLPHNYKSKNDKASSRDPLRYWKRSKIPLEISQALKSSLTGQKRLEDFE